MVLISRSDGLVVSLSLVMLTLYFWWWNMNPTVKRSSCASSVIRVMDAKSLIAFSLVSERIFICLLPRYKSFMSALRISISVWL